jgi:hypothetical protein
MRPGARMYVAPEILQIRRSRLARLVIRPGRRLVRNVGRRLVRGGSGLFFIARPSLGQPAAKLLGGVARGRPPA